LKFGTIREREWKGEGERGMEGKRRRGADREKEMQNGKAGTRPSFERN